jgi:hypothetical protein
MQDLSECDCTPDMTIRSVSVAVVVTDGALSEIRVSRILSRAAPDIDPVIIATETAEHVLDEMEDEYGSEYKKEDFYEGAISTQVEKSVKSVLANINLMLSDARSAHLVRPAKLSRIAQGGVIERGVFETFAEANAFIAAFDDTLPLFTVDSMPDAPVTPEAPWSRFSLEFGERGEGNMRHGWKYEQYDSDDPEIIDSGEDRDILAMVRVVVSVSAAGADALAVSDTLTAKHVASSAAVFGLSEAEPEPAEQASRHRHRHRRRPKGGAGKAAPV